MKASPDILWTKIQRSARSVLGGEELLTALTSDEYRNAMHKAVKDGVPPVAYISGLLVNDFPSPNSGPDIEATTVRQFIGSAVRAILAQDGYEFLQGGVRTPGTGIFRSGAIYRKKKKVEDFIRRFKRIEIPEERYTVFLTKEEFEALKEALLANRE